MEHSHLHPCGLPGGSDGKESAHNMGDLGSIPASGSSPGRGNGYLLQYSCLRNLYAGQEATVRTGHGTTDWSKLGKEYIKAVYCHPAYLTYVEYIMRNIGLDEAS